MSRRFSQFASNWRRLIGVSLLALAVLVGCSAKKRYQVLSVFFDGVPDPDLVKTGPAGFQSVRGTKESPVFVHRPYSEKNCAACHLNTDNMFAKARVPADACLKCHADVMNAYPVMHGPVVANACLKCHLPHQSRNEHLARQKTPQLCTQCHVGNLIGSMPPEHLDPKSDCLSCHFGHGGKDHAFLKVAKAPASRPSGSGVAQ